MLKLYYPVAAILYVVIFALRVFDVFQVARFFIPVFVLLTAIASFVNARDRSFKQGSLMLSIALLVAFCADTVINLVDPILPVKVGVIIFLACHICLLIYFFRKKSFEAKELLYILPLLGISAIFCIAIVPLIESALLMYGVPFYMLLLTLMLWRAVCLYKDKDNVKIILGAILFFITDISVIMIQAYGNITPLRIETWAVYPHALFLLSLVDNKEKAV
uniref:YhhN-like protein n=1 Tax=uncultured bacterium contig00049 TaxID=1181534 RepID=A0A806JYS5_9BACT|nr:hypothetical protein [uncultured bacterium contig00049]